MSNYSTIIHVNNRSTVVYFTEVYIMNTHTHEISVCDTNCLHTDNLEELRTVFPSGETFESLSSFFKVLGDPTRIKIMWALDRKELCVCDIADLLNMTKSAVSHQLALLRHTNLVKYRKEGKSVFYTLSDEHVRQLFEAGLDHINE